MKNFRRDGYHSHMLSERAYQTIHDYKTRKSLPLIRSLIDIK